MKNLSNQTRLEIDEASISKEYWDSKAKETGFKGIGDFLGYFKIHSRTPRALFSGQHIEIMLALGEYSKQEREKANPHNFFNSIHYDPNLYEIMKKRIDSLI